MTTRAALYLRVSSEEQTYENQAPDLERLARTRGFEIVETYAENVSAVKVRPEFNRLREDAHRGRFDVLLVWALDRLGRDMIGNLQIVADLDRCGIRTISVTQPWLDTTNDFARTLLLAIFSAFAAEERRQIVARTKAGMARAQSKGIHCGRPLARVDLFRVEQLKASGKSSRFIAKELRVPVATLLRAWKRSKRVSSGEGA